jgi:hypothetical protein
VDLFLSTTCHRHKKLKKQREPGRPQGNLWHTNCPQNILLLVLIQSCHVVAYELFLLFYYRLVSCHISRDNEKHIIKRLKSSGTRNTVLYLKRST